MSGEAAGVEVGGYEGCLERIQFIQGAVENAGPAQKQLDPPHEYQ